MHRPVLTACVGLLVAGPSLAEPVQPEMLDGYVIASSLVENRVVRSPTGRWRQVVKSETKVTLLPGGMVEANDRVTVTTEGHKPVVRNYKAGPVLLGKPFPFRDGSMVITFEDGELRRLRTLKEGARMSVYRLIETGGSITCTYEAGMLREDGVGRVRVQSNSPGRVLENREVAKDCKVLKRN